MKQVSLTFRDWGSSLSRYLYFDRDALYVFVTCTLTLSKLKEPHLRKRTFLEMRRTKSQISLCIQVVWSEPSLFAWRHFASSAIKNTLMKSISRLRECISWPESSLGAHVRSLVFWRCGPNYLSWNYLSCLCKAIDVLKVQKYSGKMSLQNIANIYKVYRGCPWKQRSQQERKSKPGFHWNSSHENIVCRAAYAPPPLIRLA